MHLKKTGALLAVVTLSVTSCRKEIAPDSIYVGEWESTGSICKDHIVVDQASNARYFVDGNSDECFKTNGFSGYFRKNASSFTIDGHKFKLVTAPTPSNVEMVNGWDTVHFDAAMTIKKPFLYGGKGTVQMFRVRR